MCAFLPRRRCTSKDMLLFNLFIDFTYELLIYGIKMDGIIIIIITTSIN